MSSFPISTARVSDPLKNMRLLNQLHTDQIALQRSFDQLSTGLRVTKVSDDPAAAGRAISLQRGINRSEQLSRNAGVTQSFYAATDTALGTLGNLLIEARGITIEAAQNTLTGEEREALAATIDQAVRSAVSSANAIFREHQLLGGHLKSDQALSFVDSRVVFSGNEALGQTYIGPGAPVAIGVSGTEAFGLAGTIVDSPSLDVALERATPLADLRQGRGVSPGIIRLSDGGDWVELDLRTADTLGDVVDAIEAISFSGRTVDVAISPDGLVLDYADGLASTLVIDDLPGSSMATDLSIRNVAGASPTPIVATKLGPRITANTPLAQLAGGLGVDVTAGIQIKQGEDLFTVDLTAAQSVGDLLVAINRSGADVRAEVDASGRGMVIRGLASGVEYSIGENGGTVAQDLGIRTATEATPLDQLNRGAGLVLSGLGPDLIIQRTDGSTLEIELEGAETIGDVMAMIRDHADNQDAFQVIPQLNSHGNGLTLIAPAGVQPLSIQVGNSSNAATALGLVPPGQTTATGTANPVNSTLVGDDYSTRRSGGAIDTLMQLAQAIRSGTPEQISQLQTALDVDREKVNQIRGRVGLWTQDLLRLREQADDNVISLKSQLSDEVDADIAQVITDISSRQTAQEASLKLIADSSRLSLLDFL